MNKEIKNQTELATQERKKAAAELDSRIDDIRRLNQWLKTTKQKSSRPQQIPASISHR